MVSSRLTPSFKCPNCHNVINIIVQTPTEQLLSFMEIIPTPASPASVCNDSGLGNVNTTSTTTTSINSNLNHAILKLKNLTTTPNNDLFFTKKILCSKCAKYVATEFSYHSLEEPGINAVISAIQEASKKQKSMEILKGASLYEDLITKIKENKDGLLYFILPYEDLTPLLKLNEIAENKSFNLNIETLVSPEEGGMTFPTSTYANNEKSPVSPSSDELKLKIDDPKEKEKEQNIFQHLVITISI